MQLQDELIYVRKGGTGGLFVVYLFFFCITSCSQRGWNLSAQETSTENKLPEAQ